ncbi:hypothetical protein [Erythrobacter ani]|uniref:Uncharacterized protein n=1 Tax=Erythrobacter ani TaxID=2827235 RepID=A0ABS6SPA2_9SPHN|nr:hypothetical protein [Erythrobacter ani]MBV7266863.1 hypothetical protein [Erythrobacter ani]
MSLFARAKQHAWRMAVATMMAILFVLAIDMIYGHSTVAFAIAIVALIWLNMPMLRFNCPRCGYNIFFRGMIVIPWPRRECGKCGLQLDAPEQS